MSSLEEFQCRVRQGAAGHHLRLVPTPSTEPKSSWDSRDDETIQQGFGFPELMLIQRSLEAVRTLGLVERQDTLLNDTINLIEVAVGDALMSEKAEGLEGSGRRESFLSGRNPLRRAVAF